jgi:DNA polymerase-3 subunit beta
MDPTDFHPIASVNVGAKSIAADVLRGMFDRTFASISKDETRVHLNALLLEWTDNEVRMVATDGHRLAFERAHVATRQPKDVSFLLSRSAVVAVRSAIKGTDGLVSLAFGTNGAHKNAVTFRADGVTVTSRGVDAQFPPYAQVIPANHPTSVRLSRVAFIDAVRTVAVAASDRTGGIKLSVGPFGFFLSAESPDSGNAHASLPTIGDPPVNEFRAGVNSVYLLDALTSLECDEFIFSCNGPLDPMTIHPYNVDTLAPADSLAVVMPMRI